MSLGRRVVGPAGGRPLPPATRLRTESQPPARQPKPTRGSRPDRPDARGREGKRGGQPTTHRERQGNRGETQQRSGPQTRRQASRGLGREADGSEPRRERPAPATAHRTGGQRAQEYGARSREAPSCVAAGVLRSQHRTPSCWGRRKSLNPGRLGVTLVGSWQRNQRNQRELTHISALTTSAKFTSAHIRQLSELNSFTEASAVPRVRPIRGDAQLS